MGRRSRLFMGNALKVFKRDVLRLLKTPAALVVVVALVVLPSLYTWYNVVGFWDPYDNTQNIMVSVVNKDAGAESDLTGPVQVGDMIVSELEKNAQLHWVFEDEGQALDALKAGRRYAVFVIPEDFSACLLSMTSGQVQEPKLQYYVNEKTGPVAPKITDTGASTLDETINSAFVKTVSDVAVKAVDSAVGKAEGTLDESKAQATLDIDQARSVVAGVRATLDGAASAVGEASAKSSEARSVLGRAGDDLAQTSQDIQSLASDIGRAQDGLLDFGAAASPVVGEATKKAAAATSDVQALAHDVETTMSGAHGKITAAVEAGKTVLAETKDAADVADRLGADLDALLGRETGVSRAADLLQKDNAKAESMLAEAQKLADSVQASANSLADSADAVDGAMESALGATNDYAGMLFSQTIPNLSKSLGDLGSAAQALASSVERQRAVVDDGCRSLDSLDELLSQTSDALAATDEALAVLDGHLESVEGDVTLLASSSMVGRLFGKEGLDAARIADFMGSPTEVKTERLYPLDHYGSAMAPLFMNLTFWIGAFMLLVIMKAEVDDEGVPGLTVAEGYLGRFLLFAVLVVCQAAVCCAGVCVIGVQTASTPALYGAAVVTALAYLSVIYALSVTLQHVGMGLCIILVFAQIPAATGLYPVELTSNFFQAVYPLLPFTYGIGALREAICGFYGIAYGADLAALAAFFVAFMAFGLLVRPLVANVNRLFSHSLEQAGVFVVEKSAIPARRFRFSQLARALVGQQAYQRRLRDRYDRYLALRPVLIRVVVVLSVVVPVALVVAFALTPAEKVVLLTVWLAWVALVFVALIAMEYVRYGLERQLRLGVVNQRRFSELVSGRAGEKRRRAAPARAARSRARASRPPVKKRRRPRHPAPPRTADGPRGGEQAGNERGGGRG
ncbi:YhgE/Pip domain-containing protein [Eggerthellaceae bacterium zg-886]|uniref:YhgE/Pip domain-containing protein n=2 Tax=Xiamenia xianingshaonis TaxID=2682776 RepID=A0ABX0IG85_9ACTN|nr:YhgE/Pip domain-containing protein [Xiamenia xianingshaonis]